MYVLKQKKAKKEIDSDSNEEEGMIQKPNDSTSNSIVMYIDKNNIKTRNSG